MTRSSPPKSPGKTLQHAESLLTQGLVQGAHALTLELIRAAPNRFEPMFLMASIEQRRGNLPEAIRRLEQCLKIKPGDTRALVALSFALHLAGRADEAIAVCDRGLELRPGEPAFILQKATVLDQRNDAAGAWETMQPLLRNAAVSTEIAGVATRVLSSLGRHDEAIRWAQQAAEDSRSTDDAKRTLWLYLAKVYDTTGQYDQAFDACVRAHSLVKRRFDAHAFGQHVDALIETFSASALPLLPRGRNTSQKPVFVIGMPRSGTSLVEQIIASHPQAFGAGEINDIDRIARSITAETGSMHVYPHSLNDMTADRADRFAQQYLDHLNELAGDAQRITNKMLEQYEHVGLIWMLLPAARIIHIRRDPRDVCLSCFTRHLNPERMPYATNLEHLGLVYRQHERLMDHWKATLDLPILTVQYEQLVADQQRVSKEVIEFLGLPWDERCLRYFESKRTVMTLSYDQVNKPIYDSSIGRWKHYAAHLQPLFDALGE